MYRWLHGRTTASCPGDLSRSLLGRGWKVLLLEDFRATSSSSSGVCSFPLRPALNTLFKIVEPGTYLALKVTFSVLLSLEPWHYCRETQNYITHHTHWFLVSCLWARKHLEQLHLIFKNHELPKFVPWMIGILLWWCSVVLYEPVTLKQLISHGRSEFITHGLICPSQRYLISNLGALLSYIVSGRGMAT